METPGEGRRNSRIRHRQVPGTGLQRDGERSLWIKVRQIRHLVDQDCLEVIRDLKDQGTVSRVLGVGCAAYLEESVTEFRVQ